MLKTTSHQFQNTWDFAQTGFAVEYYPDFHNQKRKGWHTHDVLYFSLILSGTATHYIGDEAFTESAGSLGIVHYEQPHEIVTSETSCEVMNIFLDPRTRSLPKISNQLEKFLYEILPLHSGFAHHRNRIVHLQFSNLAPIRRILLGARHEQVERQTGHEEALRGYCKLFLIECARQLAASGVTGSAHTSSTTEATMETLRQRLERDYTASHRVETFAIELGMNKSYLCRQFKKYTGHSILNYLLHRRVQAAMAQLRSTSDKVLAVAYACGFRDLGYFNRQFKSIIGMSPRAYRQKFQE